MFVKHFMLFSLFAFCFKVAENFQNKYTLTNEFGKVAYENTTLVEVDFNFFKLNRTTGCANVTIFLKKMVDESTVVRIQAQPMINNQYTPGAIDFVVKMCPALSGQKFEVDLDLSVILAHSNLTTCPVKPGVYVISHAIPDGSLLPPLLPAGRYLVILDFIFDDTLFATIHWYMKIEYKIKY